MKTRTPTPHLARWGRWSLVAMTLGMGATLLFTAWAHSQRVEEVSEMLIRGRAASFLGILRSAQFGENDAANRAELERILLEHGNLGLRYLGLLNEDGSIRDEVGRAELRHLEPGPPGEPLVGQTRALVRFVVPRRLLPIERRLPIEQASASMPPRVRSFVAIEFEPKHALQIERDADRALIINALTVGLFVLLSGIVWHLLRRREDQAERVEHEARLVQLGEMSAILAHEMRNPLTSLKGHAQLLTEALAPDSPEHKKSVRIVKEAERLEALGTTLLDFVQSGSVNKTPTAIRPLLERAVQNVDPHQRVELLTPHAPSTWLLDGPRIEQVVVNLLENALLSSDAAVRLGAFEIDDALCIEVRDEGPGIALEDLDWIFEPFHSRRARGVGLGLAVARRIVSLHGGRLEADNASPHGAVFVFRIPR